AANQAYSDATIAGRSATAAQADARAAQAAATQAQRDADAANTAASGAEKAAADANTAAENAQRHAESAAEAARNARNSAVEAGQAAGRAETAERERQDKAKAEDALREMRSTLQRLRDEAAKDPSLGDVVRAIDQLMGMIEHLLGQTLEYLAEHGDELLLLLENLAQTAVGAGLAYSGVVTAAGGAAVCAAEIAAAAGAGAGAGAVVAGVGAVPGALTGALTGLLICAMSGGPAIVGGVSQFIAGMAVAMDGLNKAATNVQNLGNNKNGSLEGKTDHVVYDPAVPNNGRPITDIDRVENGVLWEEKTAIDAQNIPDWVGKHVDKKLNSYLEARKHLQGYENAPIGLRFTQPGATPAFKAAVEKAVDTFRKANTSVRVMLDWK
ncbi:hypothetical protein ACFTTZ_42620, partial [Amycolatopsis thailandensis]